MVMMFCTAKVIEQVTNLRLGMARLSGGAALARYIVLIFSIIPFGLVRVTGFFYARGERGEDASQLA